MESEAVLPASVAVNALSIGVNRTLAIFSLTHLVIAAKIAMIETKLGDFMISFSLFDLIH